jgi:hypothetical protein
MIDATIGQALFRLHRRDRAGINRKPEMASVCLICGSVHIDADPTDGRKLVCRNCGFVFTRYSCAVCGATVDSRDPGNPMCRICRAWKCLCGRCACPEIPTPE